MAKVGAQTRDLDGQIDDALAVEPDVAVIQIGANDVTHARLPSESVRLLALGVRRLRDAGVQVVVGTCPDLGTVEPVPQPLRYVARRWSRQLAAAQTIVVVEAGGRTVSLGDILGPEFAASPKEMFGPDRFHPSATGYASAAAALLPSVCAALDVWFEADMETTDLSRDATVQPIAELAAIADEVGAPVLHAMSLQAAGSLCLHHGDPSGALDHAQQAAVHHPAGGAAVVSGGCAGPRPLLFPSEKIRR